jgi:hypothetical protein
MVNIPRILAAISVAGIWTRIPYSRILRKADSTTSIWFLQPPSVPANRGGTQMIVLRREGKREI